jgi:FtsZ-interacting cell division protein YlmF
MFKSFMGIFKKDEKKNEKKEDKNKQTKDAEVEGEKEEADEKQIDELINSDQQIVNKNSPYFLFLEKDEERRIITEVIKEQIQDVSSLALWEAFYPALLKWEYINS